MDITDISKVASRKRMNTDAEKLREKVSRETAKIIKLKVAQDTAYWDLKERLQQLEGAHERLQQNMVDVQMQHEAASAQYARELRLRPDTLNKLQGTRGVCDVLEQYGARLRGSVARGRADRAALQAAYAQCAARVRRLAADVTRARDAATHYANSARQATERQCAEGARLADALQQLGAARAAADELRAARHDLADHHQRAAKRADQAEAALATMRDEALRQLHQFNAQTADLKQTIARHENELSARREAGERLQRELAERAAELRRAHLQHQDDEKTIDQLKSEDAAHVVEIKNLEKVVTDKNQNEEAMKAEIASMEQRVRQLEAEKLEMNEQLSKSVQECDLMKNALSELTADNERLRSERDAVAAQRDAQRDADAKLIEEARAAAAALQRELDAHSGTIARLMSELRAEADARARADHALSAARRHADAERDAAARKDQALQAKDEELSAQMTIILDMRGEKERLQERIQGMQNTIDNIQKELTGRLRAPAGAAQGEPPELDGAPQDATVYSFLSDGSADGDALDPREVGRRFDALALGGARTVRHRTAQGSISLSQVKDDLKIKSRTFFKNRRYDSKPKKLK